MRATSWFPFLCEFITASNPLVSPVLSANSSLSYELTSVTPFGVSSSSP